MVPEGKCYRNFLKDRDIHGESYLWRIAKILIKTYRFDAHAGFE